MSKQHLVYALRDPRTDEYWYVGKSASGLRRPKEHFSRSHNPLIREWVISLSDDGFEPVIDVLEEVELSSDLLIKERFWIVEMLRRKHPLANIVSTSDTFQTLERIKCLKRELGERERALLDKTAAVAIAWKEAPTLLDFPSNVAAYIKKLRKLAELSRNDLAKLAGVGKTVVFDIEHGKSTVRLDTLLKVLSVLNCKVVLLPPQLKPAL